MGGTWRTYLERLVVLLLLLVNYPKSEVDFMGLVETRVHCHDIGKGFLRMIKRAEAVVQNTYTVPESRFLGTSVSATCKAGLTAGITDLRTTQALQSVLVGIVGLLEVIHHEETVS